MYASNVFLRRVAVRRVLHERPVARRLQREVLPSRPAAFAASAAPAFTRSGSPASSSGVDRNSWNGVRVVQQVVAELDRPAPRASPLIARKRPSRVVQHGAAADEVAVRALEQRELVRREFQRRALSHTACTRAKSAAFSMMSSRCDACSGAIPCPPPAVRRGLGAREPPNTALSRG